MNPIILIGPIGAGKTTVGELLSKKLSIPFYSLDLEEKQYTSPLGYDEDEYDRIKEEQGPFPAYDYARGFFDEAVVRFLAAHDEGVLDMGGGHPIVPDPEKQKRIKKALEPYKNIILLLPTPNLEESLGILYKRNEITEDIPDFNTLYFKDRTFWDIAKSVVYTEGRTPEQSCAEIVEKLKEKETEL